MNSDLEDLFDAARRLKDPAQLQAFLDAACRDDNRLRQELEELLALQPQAQALLDSGVAALHPEASELREIRPAVISAAPFQERIGERVGRYKLREKIGEGGCGVVYVADQEEPVRRRVALKVIKTGMDTRSVIALFDAERQALAMMDHPDIAKVLDAGATEAGRPYFVMELVRGIKITEFCDQNRFTAQQRLELFIKVCQAVQHAHQKGVIHRDLKPSNILVTINDGVAVPKIIDFGIAKATEGRLTDLTVYTELNQLLGTPAYMSPEQALMTSVDIDTRSDIYSLGVLLYELLTGRPPFENRELLTLGLDEMRRTIREKEPLRPSTRLTRLPSLELDTTAQARGMEAPRLCSLVRGDLDWIVMKCLEKDRARRYETANDLAADLKRHLNNEPVAARPPSRIYEFQKTVRRHKAGFVATAAVMAILALAAAGAAWQAVEQVRLRREIQAESYTSDVSLAKQAWDEGRLQRAKELLQSHIPKPGEPDLRGFEWRYLWDLFQVDSLKTIPYREDPAKLLANTPSHSVVVVCCDKTIRLLDPKTGTELDRFSLPDSEHNYPIDAVALASQATNLLATHRTNGVVTLWDLGRKARLLSFPGILKKPAKRRSSEGGKCLALSADGRFLACASPGSRSSELNLWDVSGTGRSPPQLMWTKDVTNGVMCMAFTPDSQTLITAESFRGSTLRTWDVKKGATNSPFPKVSNGNIYALAISSDGTLAAYAGLDPRIHVFDLASRTWQWSFEGHSGEVHSLAFSPDNGRLVSGGDDGTVRIWDIRSHKAVGLWPDPHGLTVQSVAFAPGGSHVLSANSNEVRMWSAEPDSLERVVDTHQEWGELAISPNGKWLVTSDSRYSDGHVAGRVWDVVSRQQKFSLECKNRHPVTLAFSPQDDLFALGDVNKEGVIGVWNTAGWDTANGFVEPFRYLTNGFECGSLCFSPNGKILAAAGLEFVSEDPSGATNRLAFWDVPTWKRLNLLPGAGAASDERGAAATVDFSNDGRLVAIGHRDGWVRLWDFKQQRLLKKFKLDNNSGFGGAAVRFSNDSRWLVAFMIARRGLALFDLADLKRDGPVLSVNDPASTWGASFAPDGKSLVTADNDGLIKFWNLQTCRVALTLRHGHGPGGYVAFASDGNLLGSKDGNGVMKLWRAPSLKEIDERRNRP